MLQWDTNLLCYIHDPHEDVSGVSGYLKRYKKPVYRQLNPDPDISLNEFHM